MMRWPFKHLLSSEQTKLKQPSAHRRISLVDEAPVADCMVFASGSSLTRLSQPGSLSSSPDTISPASKEYTGNGPGSNSKIAARNLLRRTSLPAMHLAEKSTDSSVISSSIVMINPPTFDNPLRRRGCCDHKHTEQLSEYRREAIQRDLRAKQAAVKTVNPA